MNEKTLEKLNNVKNYCVNNLGFNINLIEFMFTEDFKNNS